ncbi:TPR repeat-containing protein [Desulfatibacillum aliphaticivorans]|uniref:TPR repeat-containing protein n=1 Tax=Desulfatibacillum aliphaticivorans TaxID=218208 RepID=B8FJL2_DESAL|nr:TPR repeat-containing protein [Desulfatibacillum aliphaticivorans]
MLGKFDQAEPLYKRAMQITEKTYGRNNPNTANVLFNTGLLCYSRKEYKKAVELVAEATDIMEKTLGADHPETIRYKDNLKNLRKMMD